MCPCLSLLSSSFLSSLYSQSSLVPSWDLSLPLSLPLSLSPSLSLSLSSLALGELFQMFQTRIFAFRQTQPLLSPLSFSIVILVMIRLCGGGVPSYWCGNQGTESLDVTSDLHIFFQCLYNFVSLIIHAVSPSLPFRPRETKSLWCVSFGHHNLWDRVREWGRKAANKTKR